MAPPKRRRVDDGDESGMAKMMKEMVQAQKEMTKTQKEIMKNQKEMTENHMEIAMNHEEVKVNQELTARNQIDMYQRLEKRINQLEEKLTGDDQRRRRGEKEFVMKHTFQNVLNMSDGREVRQPFEEHFGRKWFTYIRRSGEYLCLFVATESPEGTEEWAIETEQIFELKMGGAITSRKHFNRLCNEGNAYGSSKFLPWDEMKRSYLKNGALTVQARVKILKMTGIVIPKAFHFDESNKKYSDIVLKVGDEKFYVSKGFLTRHSKYFESMFSENFEEGQPGVQEVTLQKTDAEDFQHFLEVLHRDARPDDETVEGILHVSDQYDFPIVHRECVEFLMNKSEMSLWDKLDIASCYHLNALADKCISELSAAEYKEMVADGFMKKLSNKYVTDALFQKSATFF